MSIQQWWNDTDRGTQKYLELSQCQTLAFAMRGWRLIKWANTY